MLAFHKFIHISDFTFKFPAAQTVYLLYASDNNQNFKISRLDANYYNVVSQTSVLSGMFFRMTSTDKLLP